MDKNFEIYIFSIVDSKLQTLGELIKRLFFLLSIKNLDLRKHCFKQTEDQKDDDDNEDQEESGYCRMSMFRCVQCCTSKKKSLEKVLESPYYRDLKEMHGQGCIYNWRWVKFLLGLWMITDIVLDVFQTIKYVSKNQFWSPAWNKDNRPLCVTKKPSEITKGILS